MGKEGERAYTNEHVNRGYERGLTPARERWEWSCITWTREQGVRERPHSSYPFLGNGGNGQEQREHGCRGVREAELKLHHARRIGERWGWLTTLLYKNGSGMYIV